MRKFAALFLLCLPVLLNGQDDLLNLLDSAAPAEKKHDRVFATFKGSKIISMQTTETVKRKTMDFTVTHRFGNIGSESGGGPHQLYGFDNSSDIRIGFDFGITDDLTLGIGRSKANELIDGLVKYRFLTQTTDNHIPVSVAIYADMSFNPQVPSSFHAGMAPDSTFTEKLAHRFAYTTQLLIARKFGSRFSIQLAPTYQHRNFVVGFRNPENEATETNGIFACGIGGRIKLTKRISIIADYYYLFSDFRKNNPEMAFHDPLSVGIEIETGGHVFHLNFTNSTGIIENNYIPYTTDDWLKGGFKFGFNISRVFNLGKRR